MTRVDQTPTDCTIVASNSPLASALTHHAAPLVDAGLVMAAKLHQPGDTASDHLKQAVSHGMQAVLRDAGMRGASDNDMFVAAVSAMGWLLATQKMEREREVYAYRFALKMLLAAQMLDRAKQSGFPTEGRA